MTALHKLLFFACTCALLFPTQVSAQESNADPGAAKFSCGVLLGITVSSFKDRIGEFGDGQSSQYQNYIRTSAALGFHARYQLAPVFSLRSGLEFIGRGGAYRNDDTGVVIIGGNGEKTFFYKNYRLNYAEIPLLAELDLTSKKDWDQLHFRVAAGVSYGMLTKSSLRYNEFESTGSGSGPLVDVDESYDVTDFDYGRKSITNRVIEFSFDFTTNQGQPIFLRVKNEASLTPVYDRDTEDGHNMKTKMNTWMLSLGLYFKGK